jgi:hypothetical protein
MICRQLVETRICGKVCGSPPPPGHRKYVTDAVSCHLAFRVIAHFSFYELYAALMKRLTEENVTK